METVTIKRDTAVRLDKLIVEYMDHIYDCPAVGADGFVDKNRAISETLRQFREDARLLGGST